MSRPVGGLRPQHHHARGYSLTLILHAEREDAA
jgi:hypothetical protein